MHTLTHILLLFFSLIVHVFFKYKYPHAGLLHKDMTPFHSGGVSFFPHLCQLHHYTALKMELVGLTAAYSRPLALPPAKICASVFPGDVFSVSITVMLCTQGFHREELAVIWVQFLVTCVQQCGPLDK